MVDVLVPPDIHLGPLLVAAPAITPLFGGPRTVGLVAVLAVIGQTAVGVLRDPDELLSANHEAQIAALVLVGTSLVIFCVLRERRAKELAQVRYVSEAAQRVVLPPLPERLGPLGVASLYLAAEAEAQIGGDLYAAARTSSGTRLIVGDVRGKGMAAVHDAAALLGAFRVAARRRASLGELVAHLDRSVCSGLTEPGGPGRYGETFITATVLDIPDEDGRVEMIACGHPPPVVLRDGRPTTVDALHPAPPLGLGDLAHRRYHVNSFRFDPGDLLMLYTDGVTEARDSRRCVLPARRARHRLDREGSRPLPRPLPARPAGPCRRTPRRRRRHDRHRASCHAAGLNGRTLPARDHPRLLCSLRAGACGPARCRRRTAGKRFTGPDPRPGTLVSEERPTGGFRHRTREAVHGSHSRRDGWPGEVLREVVATRYVTPLREGGSLPGIVEADDLGTYVMKFTGAGQGRKTLVAEVVCGELGRRLGLRVPELVTMQLDPVIGLAEPDQEVQELLKASGGLNLGMDYLPGSLGFDPLAYQVDPAEAGKTVWFDALINNVDRSWRNPNMLVWHGDLWLIDHGATMIWHHNWPGAQASAAKPYNASDHVLAPFGPDIEAAAAELAPLVTEELLTEVAAEVPDEWLAGEPGFATTDLLRRAYVEPLLARAGSIHERISIGEPTKTQPSRAPGWLAERLAPRPNPADEDRAARADTGRNGEGSGR